jgi:cytidylate kinase
LEAENLALKSVLNSFIEKIYKLKGVDFEDQSIKDIKLVNSAAFDLFEQVTQIIKQDK